MQFLLGECRAEQRGRRPRSRGARSHGIENRSTGSRSPCSERIREGFSFRSAGQLSNDRHERLRARVRHRSRAFTVPPHDHRAGFGNENASEKSKDRPPCRTGYPLFTEPSARPRGTRRCSPCDSVKLFFEIRTIFRTSGSG